MFTKQERSLIFSAVKSLVFSQVDNINKFSDFLIFKIFEFIKYSDDVK